MATIRAALRKQAQKVSKTAKLGSGKRFAAVKRSVAAGLKPSQVRAGQTKGEAAAAITAAIGRRKYGKRRLAKWSAAGRRREA